MRKQLEQKYEKLFDTYGFERPINAKNINETIRHSLRDFLEKHKNVAIYCNGGHTKMLMSDFIFVSLDKASFNYSENYQSSLFAKMLTCACDEGFFFASDTHVLVLLTFHN